MPIHSKLSRSLQLAFAQPQKGLALVRTLELEAPEELYEVELYLLRESATALKMILNLVKNLQVMQLIGGALHS